MVASPRPDLDPLDRFVVVDGPGSVVVSVARLLRAEGVRSVQAGVWAADSADAEVRRSGTDPPDLVILVRSGLVDPRLGEPWRRRRVPHLPITTSATRVVVGPWLTGDPEGPCLGCLTIGQRGRPARLPAPAPAAGPAVQPAPGPAHGPADGPAFGPAPGPASEALVMTGAGMAAMVALAGLAGLAGGAGRALPAGVSVEVHAPWPRVDHRRWSRDLDCPWHTQGPAAHAVGQAVRAGR